MAREISDKRRLQVLTRDAWRCWYCGRDLSAKTFDDRNSQDVACIDHVMPQSRGGDSSQSNLVTCCRSCNSQKRNRTLEEYRNYLRYSKSDKGQCVLHLRLAQQFQPKIDPEVRWLIESLEVEIGELTFYGEVINVS